MSRKSNDRNFAIMMNCTVDFPFNRLRISVPVVGWLLVLVVALLLTGCRRSDDEREMLRPCFEVAPVKLEEGTTVQMRVLNASDVSVVTVPECVDARVSDKAVLSLTGLSVGEGRLRVNADGQALQCTVSVCTGLAPGHLRRKSLRRKRPPNLAMLVCA